jgi:hypothetical protein
VNGNYWKRYAKRGYDFSGCKKGRKGNRTSYKANKARVRRHLDRILRDCEA